MSTALSANDHGWLRGSAFDGGLIFGTAGLALIAGYAAGLERQLMLTLLALDIWLLAYPHVIATFTRLSFDSESFRKHRFLMLGLPPILLVATFSTAYLVGPWLLFSIYFYWQWFHYTRQSFGLEQIYRRKANGPNPASDPLTKWAFYLVPIWGILHRSHQDPGTFMGLPLACIPVPSWLLNIVAFAALSLLVIWSLRSIRRIRRSELQIAHTLYATSHFWIFLFGYVLIEDITQGWLVLNIWHNAQYLLIVWMYNNRRFNGQVDPRHRFLSTISRSRGLVVFFLVCLAMSTAFYLSLRQLRAADVALAFPVFFIVVQAINYHHYIVDGLIWKVRRRSIQTNLGLATEP